MARPVTLFTGQWADLPLETICQKVSQWGYDGLELACWGDHFNVGKALTEDGYCQGRHELLARYGLKCWAISNHLTGQLVLDVLDDRTDDWAPAELRGQHERKREWAIGAMKDTARAAAKMGLEVVNGFTGSSIWHLLYSFPPVSDATIRRGFDLLAERWNPILDVFGEVGVRFALEVHPTEIAFDLYSAQTALDALWHRPEFGFNFDPSHFVWQQLDPSMFLQDFADRIFHVHCKESVTHLDGRNGRLGSHLPWADPRRGWDFVSVGHGEVPWERIFRTLNAIGYDGPTSVEWEDAGMDRLAGAPEALAIVRKLNAIQPPAAAFDAAFSSARA